MRGPLPSDSQIGGHQQERRVPSDEAKQHYSAFRMLVVDDDVDDQLLLQTMLNSGASDLIPDIDAVQDWEAAVAAVTHNVYDIALIDYRLGSRSGLELIKALAKVPGAPPMILLTGYDSPEIDQLALEAGAIDYIDKNRLDSRLLKRTLRFVLERNRVTREMAARERTWQLLFASNPYAMWLYDPVDHRIVEANESALRLYGYERAEFLKLSIFDLRPPSEQERLSRYLAQSGSLGGQKDAGIWLHKRRTGELLQMHIFGSEVEVDRRTLRLVIAVDVTAELRAEERLKASEVTLRGVLHDLGDGLVVLGKNGTVEFANIAACRMLATSEADFVGSLWSPEVLRADTHADDQAGRGGGRVFDIRVNSTIWHGIEATTVLLRDVTEERANERQLRVLQRSVEASDEGLIIVDARAPDLPIIYTNPAFERITGYEREEILGKNCRFLQNEDRNQPGVAMIRKSLKNADHCTVTLRNYRKDGRLFWNRLTVWPVRNTHGAVTHFIGLQSDITEQKRLEMERRFLETHDAVTGLPKYAGFEVELKNTLEQTGEEGEHAAVLFVDIDGFNSVNDTLGYSAGDSALRVVADRLRETLPQAGLVRYAGDEFLAIIPGVATEAGIMELCHQIKMRISEPILVSAHADLYLTCSIGASEFPVHGRSLYELIRQADLAKNRAKRMGRNATVIFSKDLQQTLHDRLALGARLRAAMAAGEVVTHYQPQINARNGEVVAFEALVRWESPELGLLHPRRFVPIAEQNGQIMQLGVLVLRSACRHLAEWSAQGLSNFQMAVNVSAAQLQRSEFVRDLRSIVEEFGVDPLRLEVEITESLFLDNVEHAIRQLYALKNMGIHVALDDFGTGYSNLSYLHRFPIDKLKIDQSFVQSLVSDGSQAGLVRAMISMGHHLGLQVLAEGVETIHQSEFLRRCQCDLFQGYFYSPPVAQSEVPDILQKRFLGHRQSENNEDQPTILLVDDEENILRALHRLLRRDGYRVMTARDASTAFDLLALHRIQVVLSDQRMPGMSGTDFLRQVKDLYPETVRMVLSGFTDLATVTDAINRGSIYKFLTKPWADEDLREQVRQAFRLHTANQDRKD